MEQRKAVYLLFLLSMYMHTYILYSLNRKHNKADYGAIVIYQRQIKKK